MANQFFYDDITSKFEEYKLIVQGVMFKHKGVLFDSLNDDIKSNFKGKVIPSSYIKMLPREVIRDYELEVIGELKEFFTAGEFSDFSAKFPSFLNYRETLLRSYVEGRLNQEKARIKRPVVSRFLSLEVHNEVSGQIYNEVTEVGEYISDISLIEDIEKNPRSYLRKTKVQDFEAITLLNSQNVAVIKDAVRGVEVFRMYSRVKRSKRELEKLTDSLTGMRSEWPFDFIATTEIFNDKDFYKGIDRITEFNKTCGNSIFKIDYRGIKPVYDKDDFDRIISQGNFVAYKLKKNPKRKISSDDRSALLKGAWIDHYPKDMALETIVMVPKFYEWYTGPIGHSSFFLKDRADSRRDKLIEGNCALITKYLESTFKSLYSVNALKL